MSMWGLSGEGQTAFQPTLASSGRLFDVMAMPIANSIPFALSEDAVHRSFRALGQSLAQNPRR